MVGVAGHGCVGCFSDETVVSSVERFGGGVCLVVFFSRVVISLWTSASAAISGCRREVDTGYWVLSSQMRRTNAR